MPSFGRSVFLFLAVLPFAAGAWTLGQGPKAKPVDAATDLLPLLKGRCSTCHGDKNPAAGLSLTTMAGLKKGGASGKTIIPKDPKNSQLVRRLRGLDGKPQMPMGFAPLTEEQIQLIERWIAEGALVTEPKTHWAYVKPARPALPKVRSAGWVRNGIDAFILARLEKEGLKPSPEASKETLLRRVTLDLTGLPPTLEELDAFLKDRSPNAYEKAVDRLLASPHYGERQARVWLDLARYADTNGFEADYSRVMWKWRDWVINAFNKNMPFDQFTVEQLAGDMLPNPTLDQRIATGFHRNTMWNSEGGVDKDEAHFEVILDRVATTGTVWLGQTFGCARCHDHKYDPIKQKEFYGLYAVWNNSEYAVEGDHKFGQDKNVEPKIEAPSPQQITERAQLTDRVKELEMAYSANSPELEKERAAWVKQVREAGGWIPAKITKAGAQLGALEVTGSEVKATGDSQANDVYTVFLSIDAKSITGLRVNALPDRAFPKGGPGRASSGNFILSRIEIFKGGNKVPVKAYGADFVQDGYALKDLFDNNVDTGWAIHPDPGKGHELVVTFEPPLEPHEGESFYVVLACESKAWPNHVLGKFSIDLATGSEPEKTVMPHDVRLAALAETPTDDQKKKLDEYFRSLSKVLAPTRTELQQTRKRLDEVKGSIPTALILKERPAAGPLKAPFHIRGEWLNKSTNVIAGTPAFLPTMPEGTPVNRLTVARWLVSPQNPLTARVQVNRMWEQYFGRGIVETSDNFGTQGSKPTHPALLDWLATEFIRLKWDMKALHRLIVTSSTYRQSSNASELLLRKDPKNELLARGPRFRLEAEVLRDEALAVGGLLDLKIGGPSVFPYQPDGIWNSPYSGEQWMTSKGKDAYRRGLYTFWKRTAPYPAFTAFDAGSREVCVSKRERTNTPLQALTLLNDKAYLEAAKGLAKRMLSAGPSSKRVATGFRLATSRTPSQAETDRLVRLAKQLEAKYAKDPAAAKKLAGTPEEAAWTLVASTILNLDETVTKG